MAKPFLSINAPKARRLVGLPAFCPAEFCLSREKVAFLAAIRLKWPQSDNELEVLHQPGWARHTVAARCLGQLAMMTSKEISVILACYCLGCFAAGYYWVRWRTGLDIRQQGSGSFGARNVGRVLGPSGFGVTFLLDLAKGAFAVWLARRFGLGADALIAALVAVVAGHNWPMQLRFHGGKGISTSLGALLAYDSFIVVILVSLFLPLFALIRNFTLSGLLAFALSPLVVFLYGLGNHSVAAVSFLAILVLWSHRRNIREEFTRSVLGRPVKDGRPQKGMES